MLYDILIIDDDFSGLSDSEKWEDNANKLLCDLLRDNLRVTWTTGELNDLRNLKQKDLSQIRYIFLDLHLAGIRKDTTSYKDINGKIHNIFNTINDDIKQPTVECLINSKYTYIDGGTYREDGINDLEQKLNHTFNNKYQLRVIKQKNDLEANEKKELLDNNLSVYAKSLIINKAIEVERVFDRQLNINQIYQDVLTITFEHKRQILQRTFDMTPSINKNIDLLQKLRNQLAHNNDFSAITDENIQQIFSQVVRGKKSTGTISFADFNELIRYVKSIDELCQTLETVKPQSKHVKETKK